MTTFTRRNQAVRNTAVLLEFLELYVDGVIQARLVNDNKDWTLNGQTYMAFPFKFTPPEDKSGQAPRATLVISNVGRGLSSLLEGLAPTSRVRAVIKVSDSASPEDIQLEFNLPMGRVGLDATVATATIGAEFMMSQAGVSVRMDPATTPGIF